MKSLFEGGRLLLHFQPVNDQQQEAALTCPKVNSVEDSTPEN